MFGFGTFGGGFGTGAYSNLLNPVPAIEDPAAEEEKRRRNPYGFLMPRTYAGQTVDPDASRRIRGQALMALGIPLMQGAGSGDFSGSLARGLAGFGEATHAGLEENRNITRQREQDEQRRVQEADQHRASVQAIEQGGEKHAAWRKDQERGEQVRLKTGKNAEQMVAEIEAMAAKAPDNPNLKAAVQRAKGYALGDDTDLNKLGAVFEDASTEFNHTANVTRAIGEKAQEHEAIAQTPSEQRQEARAERQIGLYERSVNSAADARERGGLTDSKIEALVRQDADDYVAAHKAAAEAEHKASGGDKSTFTKDPVTGMWGMSKPKAAYTADDLLRWREEGDKRARAKFANGGGDTTATGGTATGPTAADVEARLGHSLSAADRAEVDAAIAKHYTLDQILSVLGSP